MTAVPPRPAVAHNHVTRDLKPVGKCPACDDYWGTNWGYPTPADSPAAADSGTPASPRRTVTGGTTDSVAIHRPAQQEPNAAPDATAGDGLRDAIAEALAGAFHADTGPLDLRAADAVLAMPALRDVLAAAARDAERIEAVRAVMARLNLDRIASAGQGDSTTALALDTAVEWIRRALDGTS